MRTSSYPSTDPIGPLLIGLFTLGLCALSGWTVFAGLGWLGLSIAHALDVPPAALSLWSDAGVPNVFEAGMAFMLLICMSAALVYSTGCILKTVIVVGMAAAALFDEGKRSKSRRQMSDAV